PVLERRDERVLHALLGEVEIAEAAHEGRGQPTGLLAEDGGDRVACDRRDQRSTIGRTSTSLPGHDFATAIAASRSGTSMSAYPPTCSFDSMNGPSLTFICPLTRRTVVAVLLFMSSSPPLMTPFAVRSPHHLPISAYFASFWAFGVLSHWSGS